MRKILLCIVTFLLSFSLFAQEEVNLQYEIIPWNPVAKAKKYEVEIQRFDSIQNEWAAYKTETTKECQVEILFEPGEYRARISTCNILGKKTSTSDWSTFKILEEHIPYLFRNSFPESEVWKAPVLFINRSNIDISNNQDAKNYIKAPEGYPENTLFIKGKNIFSPSTEFYLIPEKDTAGQGNSFVTYKKERQEQKLELIKRDSIHHGVYVSYDKEKLYSGYYLLEARNSGNNRAAFSVLVITEEDMGFKSGEYAIDKNYISNVINFAENKIEFPAEGLNLNSAIKYTAVPDKGNHFYPFESSLSRTKIPLTVNEVTYPDGKTSILQLEPDRTLLSCGYYKINAESLNGQNQNFLVLVKPEYEDFEDISLSRFSSRINKKTMEIDININEKDFIPGAVYTLVSEYEAYKDSNERVELYFRKKKANSKTLTATLPSDKLIVGKHALMMEQLEETDKIWLQYFELDKHLKMHKISLSKNEFEETFYRPYVDENQLQNALALESESNQFEIIDADGHYERKMPVFFPNFNINFSFDPRSSSNFMIRSELGIFNNHWFNINLGFLADFELNSYDEIPNLNINHLSSFYTYNYYGEVSTRVGIKGLYFEPYIGAEYGMGIRKENIKNIEALKTVKDDSEVNEIVKSVQYQQDDYLMAQVGFLFGSFLDFRFNLRKDKPFNDMQNFIDGWNQTITIGISMPIRNAVYTRITDSQKAIITKDGIVDGRDYEFPPSVNCIEIKEGATEIKGFGDLFGIESITLPASVVKVDSDAFQNWTTGQAIYLEWKKGDKTIRDLAGLDNVDSQVMMQTGVNVYNSYYKKANITPFDAGELYSYGVKTGIYFLKLTVTYDGKYYQGFGFNGIKAYSMYKDNFYQSYEGSSQSVIDCFKTGNKLSFKVLGDGQKYSFTVITSQDDQVNLFTYEFETRNGKVTEVEIPYDKLKCSSGSKKKQLDMEKIYLITITPSWNNKIPDAVFFDFEVTK